jgi:putative ABC transport system permease protein
MSRGISQRTREIGVRRALGASDRSMMRHLLATGARQLGIGALVALPFVLVVAAAFNHFFPVGTVPTALAAVLVPLTIVGSVVVATWVPARRALRVSPRDALWRE